jgi:hypothetical protein
MAKITLSSITESIDAKYGSTVVELTDGTEVELLNPIRLSAEGRKAMLDLSTAKDELSDEEEAALTPDERNARQEASIQRLVGIVQVVAATPDQAAALIAACSPRGYLDLAIISEVVSDYMGAEKAGEASASQD